MARPSKKPESDPDDFLALGKLLREAQEKDNLSIDQVVKRFGVHKRKAYYLIQIDQVFGGLDVSRDRLRRVGWTKLAELHPFVTPDNVDRLLTLAEGNPTHRLQALASGEAEGGKTHAVVMYLTDDQYAIFREVLLAHGARTGARGLADKEAALTAALQKLIEGA
jgi:hypothetical protein